MILQEVTDISKDPVAAMFREEVTCDLLSGGTVIVLVAASVSE
jgi:hypothetical protein